VTDPLLAVPAWTAFLLAALVVLVAGRRVGTVLAVGLTAATVPWMLAAPAGTGPTVATLGFEQVFVRVDGLSRPIAALFGFVAAGNVLYGYATGATPRQTAIALVYMGAGVAAVLAGDWLTLLVAWELLAVASTVLVWHHRGAAVRPAVRYAVYHLAGGACLFAAVAVHYVETGSVLVTGPLAPGLATTLALAGVAVNLGVVGVHAWLPDTYPRPHVAASVVLAGFTTKVAVYALARVVPDGSLVVATLGGAMVVYGVTQAVLQTDLRRLLSYHIVSQVGYMVVAVGLGTAAGLGGAVAHLTAHVLYKGLLFMVAGAVVVRTGEESLKRLGGLARRMPLTFGAFLVATFAITGTPGFSGFVSKGLIAKATESAAGDLLWWALVAGSVGTVLSFAKVGYYAFLRAPPEDAAWLARREATAGEGRGSRTPALVVAMAAMAVPSVAFGLLPGAFLGAMPGAPAFEAYAASELAKAAATLGVGVLAFVVLRRPLEGVPRADVDDLLHPAGAAVASGLSAGAVAVGERASAAAGAAGTRLGAVTGRATGRQATLRATLVALAATAGLALVAALV
jgi:multicomponent Na+:H+ antiporter subunit D